MYYDDLEPCDERYVDSAISESRYAGEHLDAVVEILYGKDPLDIFKLEDHLAEVLAFFGKKLPEGFPRVCRKDQSQDLPDFCKSLLLGKGV